MSYEIKDDEMSGECSMHGVIRNAYNVSDREPEGKGPLERPRLRWKDNIITDIKVIDCEDANWIHVA